MGKRFAGTMVTAAAMFLTVGVVQGQQRGQRGQAPPPPAQVQLERQARILGRPNLNGVWQALNTAYWNLEGHSADGLKDFWQLGAMGAIPAGQSVVRGGTIPYLPQALPKRNATCWEFRALPTTIFRFKSSRVMAIL